MEPSAFAPALERLVAAVPGAHAAILVDDEGEAVDYALGRRGQEAFDVRVAGAHWRVVLDDLARLRLGTPLSLIVRSARRSYLVQPVADGCAVVVVLGRRAGFGASARALSVCERALQREAGWRGPLVTRPWHEVLVSVDASGRPALVARIAEPAAEVPVEELLGRVVNMSANERGFRVRLASTLEVTLVEERHARRRVWYADEKLES